VNIRDFYIEDYDAAVRLWKTDENIGLSSADSKEAIEHFLKQNPGLSKVLIAEDHIIGTILCGQDGRRGYLYHLFIHNAYRRKGAGKQLVQVCLDALKRINIHKCHLFIFKTNGPGKDFWKAVQWSQRNDIEVFSKDI
jgi:ribosomal protein S18 acetylase RimI-like enzyme